MLFALLFILFYVSLSLTSVRLLCYFAKLSSLGNLWKEKGLMVTDIQEALLGYI